MSALTDKGDAILTLEHEAEESADIVDRALRARVHATGAAVEGGVL